MREAVLFAEMSTLFRQLLSYSTHLTIMVLKRRDKPEICWACCYIALGHHFSWHCAMTIVAKGTRRLYNKAGTCRRSCGATGERTSCKAENQSCSDQNTWYRYPESSTLRHCSLPHHAQPKPEQPPLRSSARIPDCSYRQVREQRRSPPLLQCKHDDCPRS